MTCVACCRKRAKGFALALPLGVQSACTQGARGNSFHQNAFFLERRVRVAQSRGRSLTRCSSPAAPPGGGPPPSKRGLAAPNLYPHCTDAVSKLRDPGSDGAPAGARRRAVPPVRRAPRTLRADAAALGEDNAARALRARRSRRPDPQTVRSVRGERVACAASSATWARARRPPSCWKDCGG